MDYPKTEYVSIIGGSLIDPIATLIKRLIYIENKGPNEVQASVTENGFSVAIVVLTAIMIESVLNKTMFISTPRSLSPLTR